MSHPLRVASASVEGFVAWPKEMLPAHADRSWRPTAVAHWRFLFARGGASECELRGPDYGCNVVAAVRALDASPRSPGRSVALNRYARAWQPSRIEGLHLTGDVVGANFVQLSGA